jgi:hypothetical protein
MIGNTKANGNNRQTTEKQLKNNILKIQYAEPGSIVPINFCMNFPGKKDYNLLNWETLFHTPMFVKQDNECQNRFSN